MTRLPPRTKDLRGRVFGQLVALYVGTKDKNRNARWVCMCTCGQTTTVVAPNLVKGVTKSCGCLRTTRQAQAWAEAKARTPPKPKPKTKTKPKTKSSPKTG